jgi:hypothetical protein
MNIKNICQEHFLKSAGELHNGKRQHSRFLLTAKARDQKTKFFLFFLSLII